MTIHKLSDEYLRGLLKLFPTAITFAFAYGSSIIEHNKSGKCVTNGKSNGFSNGALTNGHKNKLKADDEKKMIDLVFVVDDPISWHQENLKLNPDHYSFLGYFGADFINYLQRNMKAQVYFNVVLNLVIDCSLPNEGRSIKYGVIHTCDLITDLTRWDNLYVAGRLHKPIRTLIEQRQTNSPLASKLSSALEKNYRSALAVALLLLPDRFTEEELFTTIVSLSYYGDFRMVVGEDKNKISSIVLPQMENFRSIYIFRLFTMLNNTGYDFDEKTRLITVKRTQFLLLTIIEQLPDVIFDYISKKTIKSNDSCVPLTKASSNGQQQLIDNHKIEELQLNYRDSTRQALSSIVWTSSIFQGIKGFFTSGFVKAIKYCARKLVRMYSSLN